MTPSGKINIHLGVLVRALRWLSTEPADQVELLATWAPGDELAWELEDALVHAVHAAEDGLIGTDVVDELRSLDERVSAYFDTETGFDRAPAVLYHPGWKEVREAAKGLLVKIGVPYERPQPPETI